jgi:hypothetical protein
MGSMGHGDWKGVRAIATLHQDAWLACPHTICRPQTKKMIFNIEQQHLNAALTSRPPGKTKAKSDDA